MSPVQKHDVTLTVNGRTSTVTVEPRKLLVDALREDLGLTGTHIGCEHGVCGTCTVLLDGRSIRSCTTFAVQADGAEIRTVEGLATGAQLHPLQDEFWDKQGLQCGFCTPGHADAGQARSSSHRTRTSTPESGAGGRSRGNLCRCTGYQFIVESVLDAADRLSGRRPRRRPQGDPPTRPTGQG